MAQPSGRARLDPTPHAPLVRRALRSLGVDADAIDDAMQDVFAVLVRRQGDFDRERSLVNWIWGIARGVASTHRRSRRRRAALLEALCAEPTPPSPQPDDVVARTRAARRVGEFVARLPAIHREVFVQSELQGRAGPEIAAALGLNLNTTYARLRVARQRFEAAFAEPDDRERLPAWLAWLPLAPKPWLTASVGASLVAMSAMVPTTALTGGDLEPAPHPTIAAREPSTTALATSPSSPRIHGATDKDVDMKPKRTIATAVVATTVALTAGTAAAAPAKAKRPEPPAANDTDADEAARKDGSGNITAVYDFVEGDRLTGEVLRPTGTQVDARYKLKFPSLLTLRGHFLPELIQLGREL
jgi:RNA polymerase sigma-70 factor (ECF subfamily)